VQRKVRQKKTAEWTETEEFHKMLKVSVIINANENIDTRSYKLPSTEKELSDQTPLNFMLNTNGEVFTFPTKFPHGTENGQGLTWQMQVTTQSSSISKIQLLDNCRAIMTNCVLLSTTCSFTQIQLRVEKKKKSVGRFNFPRLPSKRSLFASPPSTDVNVHAVTKWQVEIIQKVQDILDKVDDKRQQQCCLSAAGVTDEEYHRALSVNMKGHSLVLQRDLCDMNINNYNPTILSAWKANMDIQPDMPVYRLIHNKRRERNWRDSASCEKEHSDKDIRTQLKKIGSVFLTHREDSTQEAVFRLLSLTMLSCSVE